MTITSYPDDDGESDLEPKYERLVDPADGIAKRWMSLGFVTKGRLKLWGGEYFDDMPVCSRSPVKAYWHISARSLDGEMSQDLYQLMQAARSLEDVVRKRKAKSEYPLSPRAASTYNMSKYYLGPLSPDIYLITERREGGQELWVQRWMKPGDPLPALKLSKGQCALVDTLLKLPPYGDHTRDDTIRIATLVSESFGDEVLEEVARRLDASIQAKSVKRRPDTPEILLMCKKAATQFHTNVTRKQYL